MSMKKTDIGGMDRDSELEGRLHLTRPPRLTTETKNAKMNPKPKKTASEFRKDAEKAFPEEK